MEHALDELFQQVLAWGGVITGEHGIGLAKKRWWPEATSDVSRRDASRDQKCARSGGNSESWKVSGLGQETRRLASAGAGWQPLDALVTDGSNVGGAMPKPRPATASQRAADPYLSYGRLSVALTAR